MGHVHDRGDRLDRPEDLKGGRQDYRGKDELVPTNQMSVINAQTVNDTFELIRYDQLIEQPEECFWDGQILLEADVRIYSQGLVGKTKAGYVRSDIFTETLIDPARPALMMCLWILTT
jgi:hypothetical protein